MRYFKTTFMALAILLLVSCKETELNSVQLYQETKTYFQFKEGSTWNFVNKGNVNDKFTLTLKNFITGYTDPTVTNTEYFSYDLVQDDNNKIILRAEAGSDLKVDRITYITLNNSTFYYNPMIWYDGVEFLEKNADTMQWLNTFTINGTTYDDVMFVKLAENDLYKNIYLAKGYGIIQFTYKQGDKIYYLDSQTIVK